jgi:UDP-glucose 4-epimerase
LSTGDFAAEYEGRRVLITGGLGFIGSALARALVEAGADVVLVDSLIPEYGGREDNVSDLGDRLRINISDVRDRHSVESLVRGQQVIFNLAGQTSHLDSMTDPETDLEINCRSQLSLLEACRRNNPEARVVFASTRQLYGRPRYLPVDEEHPLAPVDVNGINKLAGEWYHLVYEDVYGIPVSVLRLTNTFGPRMRVKDARQTFLGWWLRLLLTGQELTIFGDGNQRRDFSYVDDAVNAFLLAGFRDEAVGEVFNLASTEVVSLVELAELMIRVNGAGTYRLVPFPEDRKRIDIGDYFGDSSKIQQTLGWSPTVSLEEGLDRTLAFYRQHGDAFWNT